MPIQDILAARDATAYYNLNTTTGVFDPADPATWLGLADTLEATNVMDLTGDIASDMADTTTRAEAKEGWSGEVAVLKTGRYTFDFRWETSDAFTAGLIAAWDAQSGISLCFLDRPYKGSASVTGTKCQGLGGVFSVSINKQENLRDIQKASATVTIAKFPKWVDVTVP